MSNTWGGNLTTYIKPSLLEYYTPYVSNNTYLYEQASLEC